MSAENASSSARLVEAIVSVGPDGRLYFHDLDAELIEVALAMDPDNAAMRRRLELCRQRPEKDSAPK